MPNTRTSNPSTSTQTPNPRFADAETRLLALRTTLLSRHKRAERPEIQQHAEQMDQILAMVETERTALDRDREVRQLRQLDAALAAVKDGSYGVCVDCEEPIASRRLELVPEADRCVVCQQAKDERDKGLCMGVQTGDGAEDED